MRTGADDKRSGTDCGGDGTDVLSMEKRVRRNEYIGSQTTERIGKRERKIEAFGGGFESGQCDIKGCKSGKLLSPARKKAAVEHVIKRYKITERRACRVLGVNRTAYRYKAIVLPNEDEIRQKIIETATNYGSFGYRQVTYMLRNLGVKINHKRVERIWREEGLKQPQKMKKRARIWQNDGSCVRLRAERPNHVWSYDFVEDKTTDGRKIRFLNIIDEHRHMCLASIPRRSWRNNDLIEALAELMMTHGTPEYLRSDNGSEFTAKKVKNGCPTRE